VDAWIATDGAGGLVAEERNGISTLQVPVRANGGFVAIVAAPGTQLHRAQPRVVGDPPRVEPALVELAADGAATLRTEPDATLRLPSRWRAERVTPSEWRVHAPRDLGPGQLGVIAVEIGADPVARISHARVVAPLTPGVHRLSDLPLLAFRNESGPVERDESNGGGNPRDGRPMSIGGESFDDGFGVSSPSTASVHLGARATRLVVRVGVDDESPEASAIAVVRGDGRELARTEVHGGHRAVQLDIEVTGVHLLELITEPIGDGAAHVDWASARLHVSPLDHS
jgi:hypothetical protein